MRQQRKLGQTLQLNQLETECNQLLAYIANVELTLFSLLRFARTLDEAEQIRKEHELFKANLERISISVSMLQSKAQRILVDRDETTTSVNVNESTKTPSKLTTMIYKSMNKRVTISKMY